MSDGTENSPDYNGNEYCYISSEGSSGFAAFKSQDARMVYEMAETYSGSGIVRFIGSGNSDARRYSLRKTGKQEFTSGYSLFYCCIQDKKPFYYRYYRNNIHAASEPGIFIVLADYWIY